MTVKIQPRNTLVGVRLNPLPKTRKEGLITVSNEDKAYCTGTIVSVPAGTVMSEGGQPETHDLKVGQTVLVKHKSPKPGPGRTIRWVADGLDMSEDLVGEKNIVLFEQMNILAILEGDLPEQYLGDENQLEYGDVDPDAGKPSQIIA